MLKCGASAETSNYTGKAAIELSKEKKLYSFMKAVEYKKWNILFENLNVVYLVLHLLGFTALLFIFEESINIFLQTVCLATLFAFIAVIGNRYNRFEVDKDRVKVKL